MSEVCATLQQIRAKHTLPYCTFEQSMFCLSVHLDQWYATLLYILAKYVLLHQRVGPFDIHLTKVCDTLLFLWVKYVLPYCRFEQSICCIISLLSKVCTTLLYISAKNVLPYYSLTLLFLNKVYTTLLCNCSIDVLCNLAKYVLPYFTSLWIQPLILVTLISLSPLSYYIHHFEFPAPFNPILPQINNQKILEPMWYEQSMCYLNVHLSKVCAASVCIFAKYMQPYCKFEQSMCYLTAHLDQCCATLLYIWAKYVHNT